MKNGRCCTKCKRRKGYSAFRVGSKQSGRAVRRLYNTVAEAPSETVKVAREKLERWGFNPTRMCSVWDVDKLLVRLPGTDEVFPGLDYRDRMHGIFIFLHRVIMEVLDYIGFEPKQQRVLDERLAKVCARRAFRDRTGKSYRRQKSVFDATGMTAHDKICWMFFIPHVLGHKPDPNLIPAGIHGPLMTAIVHAQLIFIAVTGKRAYNRVELETIFDRGYLMIFGGLEQIRARQYHTQYQKHLNDPTGAPLPKRIKFTSKVWKDFSTPNTDTDDTDDECKAGGLGYYSHGHYILNHQHWVEQVISAGCFGLHCTQSAEAKHKEYMHLVSARVRHLDINSTQSSMLRYLYLRTLCKDIKVKFAAPAPVRTRNYSWGLRSILFNLKTQDRFSSVAFQETILHHEVRLARVELLGLLCNKFGLSDTRASYTRLEVLSYVCGQKYIRENGKMLWATDSNYHGAGRKDRRRRDILFIKGSERTDVGTRNVLCCEAVMFLKISNFEAADFDVPPDVVQDFDEDGSVTFVVGRWFAPHDSVYERDSCHRPICPGPLHINHCLWKYVLSDDDRPALVKPDGQPTGLFDRQYTLFGRTIQEARSILQLEKRAYFCLLSHNNVIGTS